MDEYCYDNIIDLINNDSDYNFFAFAITPLHAWGINAVIEYLKNRNIIIKGYIYILSHPQTGRHLSKMDFVIDDENIKIVYGEMGFRTKKVCNRMIPKKIYIYKETGRKNGNQIYFLWTRIVPNVQLIKSKLQKKIRIISILLDDGAGSYLNMFQNEMQYQINGLKINLYNKFKIVIRTVFYVLNEKILRFLSAANGNLIDFRIFKYTKSGFVKNNLSIYYAKVAQNTNIDKKNIKIFEKCILINTQSLMECNLINENLDLKIYNIVIDLAKKLKCKVIIKPHPRERDIYKYQKMDCIVYKEYAYSQEIILANLNELPCCIISIFSSTLLNASGIFNIPAISLARIILKEDINYELKKLLLSFIKQYKGIILFPETINELYFLLNKFC